MNVGANADAARTVRAPPEDYGRAKDGWGGAAFPDTRSNRRVCPGRASESGARIQGGTAGGAQAARGLREASERFGSRESPQPANGGRGGAQLVDSHRATTVGRSEGGSGVSRGEGRHSAARRRPADRAERAWRSLSSGLSSAVRAGKSRI